MKEIIERIDDLMRHYATTHLSYKEVGDEEKAQICRSVVWDLNKLKKMAEKRDGTIAGYRVVK